MSEIIDRPIDADPAPEPDPGAGGRAGGERSWLGLVLVASALAALWYLAGWGVLAMVGAILLSIFLHEMGHYVVAKRAGMKVSEFFLFFGPRLWSFRRGETEYGLKAIPVGAYVRIVGMSNLEDIDPADEARTYRAQSYPKRLAVVLAGPFANFAIALVLLFVIFISFGAPQTNNWTVRQVVAGSAADAAGVQAGDQIISLNGEPVTDFDHFGEMLKDVAGQPAQIVVERDGQELTLNATLGWRLDDAAAAGLVRPLEGGDQIVTVNGQPMPSYDAFATAVGTAGAGTAAIVFDRGGFTYATDVTVPVSLPSDAAVGFLGVGPTHPVEHLGPLAAAGRSVTTFGSYLGDSVSGIARFFSPSGLGHYASIVADSAKNDPSTAASAPTVRPLDAGAPAVSAQSSVAADEGRVISILGVIRLGGEAAESGLQVFLGLLVIFNVFVGLFNLLPLPPLDGGHAIVATYEAIRGRISGRVYRVDMTKLLPVTYAVMILLVGIGLTSMWLDVAHPVANPFGN